MKTIEVKEGQIYSAVNKEVILIVKPKGKRHYLRATIDVDFDAGPMNKKEMENWLKSSKYELTGEAIGFKEKK